MAITMSDIQSTTTSHTKIVSDLDKQLPELQEKYGFEFITHDPKPKEGAILSNKISSLDDKTDGDGTHFIRIDRGAKSELGKMLNYTYPKTFFTWIGECGNLRNYIDFITIVDYPRHIVKKQRLNKKDILSIPRNRANVANYWALVAAGFVDKVKGDKALLMALKDNELPFVSYCADRTMTLLGKSVSVSGHDVKASKYLAIIRSVETFIKNNKLSDKNFIEGWIKDCRDFDCDLFEGLPFEV